MKQLKNYLLIGLLLGFGFLITGCDDDAEPEEEESLEVITNLTLVFTPVNGGPAVTAQAIDRDGAGAGELEVEDIISLTSTTEYRLTFEILNALDPDDVEDIGLEILEEDDEHQFFFAFTDGTFTDPTGDGNIDNAADPVNYEDTDDNGCNVGLETTWTTGDASEGTFRLRLQHQPDIKTCSTGANDGDTDIDVTFDLVIR